MKLSSKYLLLVQIICILSIVHSLPMKPGSHKQVGKDKGTASPSSNSPSSNVKITYEVPPMVVHSNVNDFKDVVQLLTKKDRDLGAYRAQSNDKHQSYTRMDSAARNIDGSHDLLATPSNAYASTESSSTNANSQSRKVQDRSRNRSANANASSGDETSRSGGAVSLLDQFNELKEREDSS